MFDPTHFRKAFLRARRKEWCQRHAWKFALAAAAVWLLVR